MRVLNLLAAIAFGLAPASARIQVAASLPDLASIASSVGGEEVEAFSIAKATANPHSVEVLPSYMIRISRAAVYLKVGLGLDGWADALIEGSRNAKLAVVDCSAGIKVLETHAGKVDASMGDVHPDGNPHYWLDPANAAVLAATIRDALKKADPDHAALYDRNAETFIRQNEAKAKAWAARMAPLHGTAIVTYHSSWAYFAKAYGLRIVGYVEPFPGIPPTARHLQELAERIRREKAAFILQEPYFPDRDSRLLERTAGIRAFKAPPSCGGPGAGEYWKHLDQLTAALATGK